MLLRDFHNIYNWGNDNTICIVVEHDGRKYALAGINFNGGVCDCCREFKTDYLTVIKAFDAISGVTYYEQGESNA